MEACDYVLPVAISLDPASPCCVLGEMTRLTERDDCHRVMDWIAHAHQALDVAGVVAQQTPGEWDAWLDRDRDHGWNGSQK